MRITSSQPSLFRRNSAVRTKRSPNPIPSSRAARLPSQTSPPRWESASPYKEEINDVPLTGTELTAC
ncbi:hypothetical protein D3C76_1426370 [compost metagenome]